MKHKNILFALLLLSVIFYSASYVANEPGILDLDDLYNYANQPVPNYITKDNTTPGNAITDIGATLGRVLFYDKNLSSNNTTACASCHVQSDAFSDLNNASIGANGTTGRHAMRLINARFGNEVRFFWDERVNSLEEQTTQPIQDHFEMGFSNTNGDPDLDSLFRKLAALDYYPELFTRVFGDPMITEDRMQQAMAQFIRSIQSFDARYDDGRSQAPNDGAPFPNFSPTENAGKNLFLAPPQFDPQGSRVGGGVGCAGCHQPPEFDIVPNTGNNGVVGALGGGTDFTVTRSPTLRDMFNPNGDLNGLLMHNAIGDLNVVLDHYNAPPNVPGLDPRLRPGGNPQRLNMTQQERDNLTAFLLTLSGNNVYTDLRWSDPFDVNGDLELITSNTLASVVLEAKVLLEGPYNGGLMDDALRSNSYLPPMEPYMDLNYTSVNNTSTEIVDDLTIFDITGNDAIMDWVFIELVDGTDGSTVVATRSALVQRDGDIVDMDGTSPLTFLDTGDGNYYVRVRHRTHLSIRTLNTVALSATSTGLLDFSSPATMVTGTASRKILAPGILALWGGDANSDNTINAADRSEVWNNRNTTGYAISDVNLDGSCNAADRSMAWNNRNKTGQ